MKKMLGLIICMLFLMAMSPILQDSCIADTTNDSSNVGIFVQKGDEYGEFLGRYKGFDVHIINSGDDLIPINITILIDSYNLQGNLNWTYNYNEVQYLGLRNGSSISFRSHFSFGEDNLKIAFIKMVVTANEEKRTEFGLRIGDYFLFLRGF